MKNIHIICASLLLVFLFFVIGCESEESGILNLGLRDWRRGNYKDAIWAFEYVLKRNPQNAHAYMGLAFTLEDMGDYEKAKEYFSKAVVLDPTQAFNYYDVGTNKIETPDIRRGWRERDRVRFDQAITSFALALEKNPESAEAHIGLATVWDDKKDYDKAIEYYSKAIEIEPKSGYFWLRGEVWLKKNNCERAIEDCTSAVNTDPVFLAAYIDRAYCYRKIGSLDAAIADYNKVLQLTSNDPRPYAARARKIALEAIGDLKKKGNKK